MNFASPLFLFAFLPLSLAVYLLLGRRLRPFWLLLAGLVFCLWAGPLYFPVAIGSLLLNYAAGGKIASYAADSPKRSVLLKIAVILNLLVLIGFKALVVYGPAGMETLRSLAGWAGEPLWMGYLRKVISLPTGISFYTFAVIAYLVDIASSRIKPAENLFSFSQFFLLFPKFTAGPITKYQDLATQLVHPALSSENVNAGLRRFIIGLGKKVLIADRLSVIVDRGVFDQTAPNLEAGTAWMLLLFYTLQIYYDFSGYTDMAIGLAQMLGFKLPENFNYPYISKSISEFWRRWHMTLSGWFREYVFYPLERKRASGAGLSQRVNILIVFLLTGLWHGLTLNFVIWGLIHGLAIAIETTIFGKKLRSLWPPLQIAYSLTVVVTAWVFFRSNSPAFALAFLGNLVGINPGSDLLPYSLFPLINPSTWLAFAAGIFFAAPILPAALEKLAGWSGGRATTAGSPTTYMAGRCCPGRSPSGQYRGHRRLDLPTIHLWEFLTEFTNHAREERNPSFSKKSCRSGRHIDRFPGGGFFHPAGFTG
ncbi:MAG: MBOAT family protein [Anaerolineaceae bacterium]